MGIMVKKRLLQTWKVQKLQGWAAYQKSNMQFEI